MLRGYRCTFIATLGCLIASEVLAKHESRNQVGQQQGHAAYHAPPLREHAETSQETNKPCLGTSRPELTCEAISAEAAIEQTTIAREQARVAGRQTALGLLTLLAAIAAAAFAERAAHYTKRSAKEAALGVTEAQRSAVAAEESLAVTRSATALQMRPYVFLTDGPTPPEATVFSLQTPQPLLFLVKNFGQIPARNVRLRGGWIVVPRPIGAREAEFSQSHNMQDLAPGDSVQVGDPIEFSEENRRLISVENHAMIIRLRVEYDWPASGGDFHEVYLHVTRDHVGQINPGLYLSDIYRQES